MAMADQNRIRLLDVFRLETERRKVAAALEIGVEQHDLAVIDELEVGKPGPANGERMGILRHLAAGGSKLRGVASRIARRGCKGGVSLDGVGSLRARIIEGAGLCDTVRPQK